MAAAVATADMTVLKNSEILVRVEEALCDMLVVSYFNEDKKFQGVLLDSTKRNLPFGVSSLHPAFLAAQKSAANTEDDKLFSASQRFGYQEPAYAYKPLVKPKQRQQKTRMTVRLRPRKVLCSKCRGICNENSENVVQTRKKTAEQSTKEKKIYLSADSTGRIAKEENRTLIMGHSLIPKLSRLHPNEITNALNGNAYARNEIWLRQEKSEAPIDLEELSSKNKHSDGSGDSNADCLANSWSKSDTIYSSSEGNSENRFIEDSRDNNSDGEHRKHKKKRIESFLDTEETTSSLFSNARTLKISYGEGEGTVLKLPAMSGDFNFEAIGAESDAIPIKSDVKAAKRALKKAKKQARRQTSPPPSAATPPPHEADFEVFQRRPKHKVKHKKKHRDEKKAKIGNRSDSEGSGDENYSVIKERCLKQKLSISLKRLNTDGGEKMDMSASSESGSESCEGEVEGEEVAEVAGVAPGAVVWGKLQGFPWWPGRVLALRCGARAQVAWYNSSTSSLMPLHRLSPFLDNFKVRFNKKKRGAYKEAVRLASLEAQSSDPLATDPLSTAPGALITPLSPPPIDVHS